MLRRHTPGLGLAQPGLLGTAGHPPPARGQQWGWALHSLLHTMDCPDFTCVIWGCSSRGCGEPVTTAQETLLSPTLLAKCQGRRRYLPKWLKTSPAEAPAPGQPPAPSAWWGQALGGVVLPAQRHTGLREFVRSQAVPSVWFLSA